MPSSPSPSIAEFMATHPTDPDACWPWRRATSTRGYGRVTIGGKQMQAHRVVYELVVGPVPDGHVVDHTCHNADLSCPGGPTCPHRACCNPSHLRTVVHRENVIAGRKGPVDICKNGHELVGENRAVHGVARPRVACRACYTQRRRSRT